MTAFSLEPPRRDLIVHHTFDDVELDRVIDHSPQSIDGKVVGNVTFGHTGVIGNAARMTDSGSEVTISALSDQMPLGEVHATSWGRSEREVDVTALNVFASIWIDGTEHTLSHSTNEATTKWQYASLDYDGNTVELRYGKLDDQTPSVVDTVEAVGDVTDFELTFYTDGYGFVDDVRVYRSSLGQSWDDNLFLLGAEHHLTEEYAAAWDNRGFPFIRGENNERLISTLGEQKDYVRRQLDAILQARHIKTADGDQLDRLGAIANISRQENEGDDHYRARIIATLAAARSRGTFDDILTTVSNILQTDEVNIEITRPSVATAEVFIETVDIENIELTTSDLETILKDAVAAGHDIRVTEQGENPFTVRNDAQTNDADLGLTSDAIATGGGLVS